MENVVKEEGGLLIDPFFLESVKDEPSEDDIVEIRIEDIQSDDDDISEDDNRTIITENMKSYRSCRESSLDEEETDCDTVATWEETHNCDIYPSTSTTLKTEPEDLIINYDNNCTETIISNERTDSFIPGLEERIIQDRNENSDKGLLFSLRNSKPFNVVNHESNSSRPNNQLEREKIFKKLIEHTVTKELVRTEENDGNEEESNKDSLLFKLLTAKEQETKINANSTSINRSSMLFSLFGNGKNSPMSNHLELAPKTQVKQINTDYISIPSQTTNVNFDSGLRNSNLNKEKQNKSFLNTSLEVPDKINITDRDLAEQPRISNKQTQKVDLTQIKENVGLQSNKINTLDNWVKTKKVKYTACESVNTDSNSKSLLGNNSTNNAILAPVLTNNGFSIMVPNCKMNNKEKVKGMRMHGKEDLRKKQLKDMREKKKKSVKKIKQSILVSSSSDDYLPLRNRKIIKCSSASNTSENGFNDKLKLAKKDKDMSKQAKKDVSLVSSNDKVPILLERENNINSPDLDTVTMQTGEKLANSINNDNYKENRNNKTPNKYFENIANNNRLQSDLIKAGGCNKDNISVSKCLGSEEERDLQKNNQGKCQSTSKEVSKNNIYLLMTPNSKTNNTNKAEETKEQGKKDLSQKPLNYMTEKRKSDLRKTEESILVTSSEDNDDYLPLRNRPVVDNRNSNFTGDEMRNKLRKVSQLQENDISQSSTKGGREIHDNIQGPTTKKKGPGKKKKCPHCRMNFDSSYLKIHILAQHTAEQDKKYFRCCHCDYKGLYKSKLRNHIINKHTNPESMMDKMKKCDKCPKMFKSLDSLQQHMTIHDKNRPIYRCADCAFNSVSRLSLRLHVKDHKFPDKEYNCHLCDFKAKSYTKLLYHKSRVHSKCFYQCHICSHGTKNKDHFRLHLLNHKKVLDDTDYKYRCDKCDYKTYRLFSFQVHNLNHLAPDEVQYFYCYHCNFKAKRKDNLKTHILKLHIKNTSKFQCIVCDFTTTKQAVLLRHIDKHAEDKQKQK